MQFMNLEVVAGDGVEPSTRGFSRQLKTRWTWSTEPRRGGHARQRVAGIATELGPNRAPNGKTQLEPLAAVTDKGCRRGVQLDTSPCRISSALTARTRQRQISQGFLNQHIFVLGITQSEIPLARLAASDELQPSEPRYGRDQRIRTIGVLA